MAPGDRPGSQSGGSAPSAVSAHQPLGSTNNGNSSTNPSRPPSHSPTISTALPKAPVSTGAKPAGSEAQPASSSQSVSAGNGYRPASRSEQEMARLRAGLTDMRYPLGFGYRSLNPVEPNNSTPSSATSSSTLPHHHHHHHHHHHAHPPTSSSSTAGTGFAGRDAAPTPGNRETPSSAVGGGTFSAASASTQTKPNPLPPPSSSTTASTTAPTPSTAAASTTRTNVNSWTTGTGTRILGGWNSSAFLEAERRREKEAQERKAKEQALLASANPATATSTGPTSPNARTFASPFGRPPGPTSPTTFRATPAPSASTAKPSESPNMAEPTRGLFRPNNKSELGRVGSRDLPSPFDRERSGSTTMGGATPTNIGHNRSMSGSSNRPETTLPSPSRSTTTPAPAASSSTTPIARNMFGQPIGGTTSTRSAETSTTAGKPATASTPATSTPASTSASAPRSNYSAYSSYTPPYMGFSSGFGGYGGFGGSWAERERLKAREKEREREREKEKERLEEARRVEEKRKQEQQATANATRGPFSQSLYGSGYGRQSAPASRIEVINVPAKPAESTSTVQSSSTIPQPVLPYGTAPTSQIASDSVINQVAPAREPRPYTYTAKNEIPPSVAPTIAKDYNYNPRDQPKDKRPRMDAAVDDARRGQAKAKRRKEDDKKTPPFGQTVTRDLSSLTREVRRWPEVNSGQVEAWLKEQPDLTRVASKEIYGGYDWTLAQGQSTKTVNEGAIVMVRVNGAFLGSSWVVRGERGWDETTPYPPVDVELGKGIESRKIWGTDVYTDDSDLGLVLIHAGWIRWTSDEEVVKREEGVAVKVPTVKDVIEVTVRVVPRLNRYTATERNGIRTRAWGNGHDGSSIVVEGVRRVTLDRKSLKQKTNRKLRLAELARQRLAVFGQPKDVVNDHRRLNGTQACPVIFTRWGPALRWNPAALDGWADWTPLPPSVPEPLKSDETLPHTIFDHDLIFINGEDRYLLYSINDHWGELELAFKKFRVDKPRRTKSLFEYITPDEVEFSEKGLSLNMSEVGVHSIPIEGFYWRTIPVDSMEDWSTSPGMKNIELPDVEGEKKDKAKEDQQETGAHVEDKVKGNGVGPGTSEGKVKREAVEVPAPDEAESESSIGSVIICD